MEASGGGEAVDGSGTEVVIDIFMCTSYQLKGMLNSSVLRMLGKNMGC